MSDHSQSGEQAVILAWADRRPNHGYWLDIGAADGLAGSNSRALAERGWPGVAVEPAAVHFDKLVALYADRDDIACVQAAITAGIRQPLVRFHYSHDLVSTTQDAHADTWRDHASFVACHVAAVTVQQLLAAFPGPYDFVSVDTEGTSLAIAEELLAEGGLAYGGLLCVECENGGDRWLAQQWCLDGLARAGVTENNLLLERLR